MVQDSIHLGHDAVSLGNQLPLFERMYCLHFQAGMHTSYLAMVKEFSAVFPNIYGSSVWSLLHVTLMASRFSESLCIPVYRSDKNARLGRLVWVPSPPSTTLFPLNYFPCQPAGILL